MQDDYVNQQGGPAFPVSIPGCGDNGWQGMTLRDYFAAQALIHFTSDPELSFRETAEQAYKMADAMIKVRSERVT